MKVPSMDKNTTQHRVSNTTTAQYTSTLLADEVGIFLATNTQLTKAAKCGQEHMTPITTMSSVRLTF
jgi:hypothetical protein